jgi:kinetochore protein NDC80
MFKRLNYPFQISKSSLYAVGSPHTWPALLAALSWVVELLTYEEKAEAARAQDFSQGEDICENNEVFLEYVAKSYHHFLAGDDDTCAVLDGQLSARFDHRDGAIRKEVDRLEGEASKLQLEIDALKAAPSAVAELSQKRADLLGDIDKFHKLIQSLQKHKKELAKKTEERAADLQSREAELRAVEAEGESLKQRVQAQAVSREDLDRMLRDRNRVEESLAAAAGQRERAEHLAAEAERELARGLEGLEALAQQYNGAAERLQLLPMHAKRAKVRRELRGGSLCRLSVSLYISRIVAASARPLQYSLVSPILHALPNNYNLFNWKKTYTIHRVWTTRSA